MINAKRNQIIKLLVAISVALLGSGCGDKGQHKDLHQYTTQVKLRPAKPLEPLPTIKAPPAYEYPTVAMRNPFKPVAAELPSGGPDQNREKEPLEAFPLDSLRMVGVLQRNNTFWAVIQGPNGDVYRATVGNYIGQHYGRVVSINTDEVKLLETVKLGAEWEARPASLALIKEGE